MSQVPKLFLNQDWVGGKTFDLSTKPERRLTSKRLKTLDKMGVIYIGLFSGVVWDGVEDFSKTVTIALPAY